MPGTTRYSASLDRMYEQESPPPPLNQPRERAGSECGSSSAGSVDGESSSPSNSKQPSGDGLIPTRSTKLSTSKPPYNPLQFIKVGPAQLAQKAQEQLKKTQEVRDLRKFSREESEEWQEIGSPTKKTDDDWQTNLDTWKCARRKRVEDVIERVQEIKQIEYEEHERNARKSKTFSEMMQQRGGGRFNLSLYTDDDDNNDFFSTSKDEEEESGTKANGQHTDHQREEEEEGGPNGESFKPVNGQAKVNGMEEHEYTYDKAIETYVKYAQSQKWGTDKLNGNSSYSSSDKDSVCSETESKQTQRHTVFETRRRKSETSVISTEKQSIEFRSKIESFNSGEVGRSTSEADIIKKTEPATQRSEAFRRKLASFDNGDIRDKTNEDKVSKVDVHKPEFHDIRKNFEKRDVSQVEVKKITPDRDASFKNKRQSFMNQSVSQVEVKKITPERDTSFKSKLASFSEQNVSQIEVRKISAERDATFQSKLAAFSEQNVQEAQVKKVTPERDSGFKDKLANFTSMEESGAKSKLSPSRSVDLTKAMMKEETGKRDKSQAFERTQSLSHIPDRYIDDSSGSSESSDEELSRIAEASDHFPSVHPPRPGLTSQSRLPEADDKKVSSFQEPSRPKTESQEPVPSQKLPIFSEAPRPKIEDQKPTASPKKHTPPPQKSASSVERVNELKCKKPSEIRRPDVKPPPPPTEMPVSKEEPKLPSNDNAKAVIGQEETLLPFKVPPQQLQMPEIPPIVKPQGRPFTNKEPGKPPANETSKTSLKNPALSGIRSASSLDKIHSSGDDSQKLSLRRRNNSASFVDVDLLALPKEEPVIEPVHRLQQIPQDEQDNNFIEADFQRIAAEAKLQDNPEDRLDFLLKTAEPTCEVPGANTENQKQQSEDELEDEMIVHETREESMERKARVETVDVKIPPSEAVDRSSPDSTQLVGVQLDEASQQLLAGETVLDLPLVLEGPTLKEPPKEKPPPPPPSSAKDLEVDPVTEISHTRTSSKELKKDMWRRRSDFLGLNWKESEKEEDEAVPNLPSAVEAVIRAERKLVQENKQKSHAVRFENFSTSRVTTQKSPKSDRRSWVSTHQAHMAAAAEQPHRSPSKEGKADQQKPPGIPDRNLTQSGSLTDIPRSGQKQNAISSHLEPMADPYRTKSSSYPDLDVKGTEESGYRDVEATRFPDARVQYGEEAYNHEVIHRYENVSEVGYVRTQKVPEAPRKMGHEQRVTPEEPVQRHHYSPQHQQNYYHQQQQQPLPQEHYRQQDPYPPPQDPHYTYPYQGQHPDHQYPHQEHHYPHQDQLPEHHYPHQDQHPEHHYPHQDQHPEHHYPHQDQHPEHHYPHQDQHPEHHYSHQDQHPEHHYPHQEQPYYPQPYYPQQKEGFYQQQFQEEPYRQQYSTQPHPSPQHHDHHGYRVEPARVYSSEDNLHEIIDKGVEAYLQPPPVPAKPPRRLAENDRPRRKKDINKHWIVQEAEQRRIDEQERGRDRVQQTPVKDQVDHRIPLPPQPLYANQPADHSSQYANVPQGTYTNGGYSNGGGTYADYVNVANAQRYATGHIHSSSVPAPPPGTILNTSPNTEKALPDSVIKTITQRVHTKQASNAQPWSPVYENLPLGNGVPPPPSSLPASGPPMLSVSGKKKCTSCGQELGRGAAMIIESLRLFYHLSCFRCCVCNQQLGNGTAGADVRVRNNRLHCHNCYSNDQGLKFSKV